MLTGEGANAVALSIASLNTDNFKLDPFYQIDYSWYTPSFRWLSTCLYHLGKVNEGAIVFTLVLLGLSYINWCIFFRSFLNQFWSTLFAIWILVPIPLIDTPYWCVGFIDQSFLARTYVICLLPLFLKTVYERRYIWSSLCSALILFLHPITGILLLLLYGIYLILSKELWKNFRHTSYQIIIPGISGYICSLWMLSVYNSNKLDYGLSRTIRNYRIPDIPHEDHFFLYIDKYFPYFGYENIYIMFSYISILIFMIKWVCFELQNKYTKNILLISSTVSAWCLFPCFLTFLSGIGWWCLLNKKELTKLQRRHVSFIAYLPLSIALLGFSMNYGVHVLEDYLEIFLSFEQYRAFRYLFPWSLGGSAILIYHTFSHKSVWINILSIPFMLLLVLNHFNNIIPFYFIAVIIIFTRFLNSYKLNKAILVFLVVFVCINYGKAQLVWAYNHYHYKIHYNDEIEDMNRAIIKNIPVSSRIVTPHESIRIHHPNIIISYCHKDGALFLYGRKHYLLNWYNNSLAFEECLVSPVKFSNFMKTLKSRYIVLSADIKLPTEFSIIHKNRFYTLWEFNQ